MSEILAPVGNIDMAQAAVHNGASAIYVGSPGLNARGRTIDFSLEELRELIDFCHLHEVKVFMAMNILIFERELQAMENYLRDILSLCPDALIVQDVGLIKLIKKIAPNQVIHASTQMTVSSAEAIAETEDLDLKRYVLSREMSLDEIKQVRKNTEKELEVFVHGALCVSYSGQCLTSESFGGRSANRGQCAQSCRLDYELYVDGEQKELGGKKYLFSPQDLCGIDEVPDLAAIGVDCFKIEGRLKSPEYVASVVKNFYRAIENSENAVPEVQAVIKQDNIVHKESTKDKASPWKVKKNLIDNNGVSKEEMASTYSRGLYPGWLHGVKHQELVAGTYSSNQGFLIGKVLRPVFKDLKGPVVEAELDYSLSPGDGVLFFDPRSGRKVGGRVFFMKGDAIGFSRDMDMGELRKVTPNWEVFRSSSPKIEASLQKTWKDKSLQKSVPLFVELSAEIGQPIHVKAWVSQDLKVEVMSEFILEAAQSREWDQEDFEKALSALSGSAYHLENLNIIKLDAVFIQNKLMRKFKQSILEALSTERLLRINPCVETKINFPIHIKDQSHLSLKLLVRKESQLDQLQALELDAVIMDFEFGKDYKPGLAKIKEMGYRTGIATLRVFKPGEDHHLKVIKWLKPDVILIRNLGALHWLKKNMDISQTQLIADYSFNITNSMTAQWMIDHDLKTLHPAHDCNKDQLLDLIQQFGASPWEISLHHYMPTFHMEHCVFAGFLSNGNSVKDCGKPCEHHEVEVRDHKGARHFLKSDQECRNTMFNGTPQSASKLARELLDFGVTQFRLEALLEDSKTLAEKVRGYSDLIHGRISSEDLYEQLGVVEKYGITEGQLFNNTPFQDRKKER